MRRLLLVGALAWLPGCPSDPPPACLTPAVDPSCGAGYLPTFTNVYNNTLREGCGAMRSACHSASGAGGLSFADQATAYTELMKEGRVKPGDPSCSELIVRIDSPGADYQMPPGDPIAEEARCAIIQWVHQGAMP